MDVAGGAIQLMSKSVTKSKKDDTERNSEVPFGMIESIVGGGNPEAEANFEVDILSQPQIKGKPENQILQDGDSPIDDKKSIYATSIPISPHNIRPNTQEQGTDNLRKKSFKKQ